jgi:integrase
VVLGQIAGVSGDVAANRARAALSSLYAWAIAEGLSDTNPVVGTRKAADERPRERVLSDEELSLIWCHVGGGDYGDIIRLLILTGQRREEIAAMLWSELDIEKSLWRIGGDRTKNGLPHDVPLSVEAMRILDRRTKQNDRDLIFGTRGPFSGWSNSKTSLDARVQTARQASALDPWRVHDIRRTVATRCADLGVMPHVVEAMLNHISGHKAGVAGIYNRASYLAEKRAAFDLWAKHVSLLATEAEIENAQIEN